MDVNYRATKSSCLVEVHAIKMKKCHVGLTEKDWMQNNTFQKAELFDDWPVVTHKSK